MQQRKPFIIGAGLVLAVLGIVLILTVDGILGAAGGGAVAGAGVAMVIEAIRGPRRRRA